MGDTVRYSAQWLRSTGQYAGDICHARGEVTEIKPLGETTLATIAWDTPNIPERVNVANLEKTRQRGR
ncbi:hypothetical protein [Singulisphaera sp. PoT]|uniref:hypothetical protein n=1 Tax=Singulisphaera sp. PoT TaxID=3411797 RepID=UPI003BF55CB4